MKEAIKHLKKAMALIAAVPDDYDLQPLESPESITLRFDHPAGVVSVFQNYGRNNRTRLFWNPNTGVIDYFYDSFNRRKAFDDFIDESIHMRVTGNESFFKRVARTIDKDRHNTGARYDRINCSIEAEVSWEADPLYQSIEKSDYLQRSFRFFPYNDPEATWRQTRSAETYLVPGERFMSNGCTWFVERSTARGPMDLQRVPSWLAELLPSPKKP